MAKFDFLKNFQQLPKDSPLLKRRAPVGGRPLTESERLAREYRTYVESRRDSADAATNGHMVNAAGRRRGISESQWFDVSGSRKPSDLYATDEMRDWLKRNGPTLSPTEWRQQARGMVDAPRASSAFLARMAGS